MNRKWTERKYHVQDNADVEHKDVKMYCNGGRYYNVGVNSTIYRDLINNPYLRKDDMTLE